MQRLGGASIVLGVAWLYAGCSGDLGITTPASTLGDASDERGAGGGGKPTTSPDAARTGGAGGRSVTAGGGSVNTGGRAVNTGGSGPVDRDARAGNAGDATTLADASAGGRPATRDGATVGPDARGTEGGSDASSGSDGSDGGSNGAVCVTHDGGTTQWPSMTPSSAQPECTPNCNVGQCGAKCAKTSVDPGNGFTGAPCDTGCCSASQVSATQNGPAWPGSPLRAALAMDAAGTAYSLYMDEGVTGFLRYMEVPLAGPGSTIFYFDCSDFDSTVSYCRDQDIGPPQVAVNGPPTQPVVYVSYLRRVPNNDPLLPAESHLRLGIKTGTQWTFEDPTIKGELHADPQGRAWIGRAEALYRRDAANRWTRIPLPCGVELGTESLRSQAPALNSFAIDAAGAVYVASGQSALWRRDPSGSWAMETTPGKADRVYAGGGTVHYSSIGSERQTGGAAAGVHYGRRVDTAWQQYDVQAGPDATSITEYQMALDPCGAPHFSIATLDTSVTYYWTLDYVRWTASGWRSTGVAGFLHDPSCALGVDRTYANFTYSGGGANVPLR